MTATFRTVILAVTLILSIGATPARAQEAEPQANQTQTVGPPQLEDFNLQGNVIRPADPPPESSPATPPQSQQPNPAAPPATRPPSTTDSGDSSGERGLPTGAGSARTEQTANQPRRPVTAEIPPIGMGPSVTAQLPDSGTAPAEALDPSSSGPGLWPWAALLLLAGGAAFWVFSRRRAALADGYADEYAAAPQPQPQPRPQPQLRPQPAPPVAAKPQGLARAATPAPAPQPQPPVPAASPADDIETIGIVSTRLRPTLEIQFEPTAMAIEDQQVVLDFELTLLNSGSLPARSVLIEATMINAGLDQEKELSQFVAKPRSENEPTTSIAPLKRLTLRNRLTMPRERIVEHMVDGQRVFLPLVAVNARYNWSSSEGQTASVFLVGRDSGKEKLAPFRIDRGPGAYQTLDTRQLPLGVRR